MISGRDEKEEGFSKRKRESNPEVKHRSIHGKHLKVSHTPSIVGGVRET